MWITLRDGAVRGRESGRSRRASLRRYNWKTIVAGENGRSAWAAAVFPRFLPANAAMTNSATTISNFDARD